MTHYAASVRYPNYVHEFQIAEERDAWVAERPKGREAITEGQAKMRERLYYTGFYPSYYVWKH